MNCRVTLMVGLHHESSESVACCLDFEYTFAMTTVNGVGYPKIDVDHLHFRVCLPSSQPNKSQLSTKWYLPIVL